MFFLSSDWGDKENNDLMKRFDVNPQDYPVFKLFRKGYKPVNFTGPVKVENLLKFTTDVTGLWFGELKF